MRLALPAALLAAAAVLVACGSPRITTNGFVFTGLDLEFLEEGETRCSRVLEELGTPTLTRSLSGGALGPDAWLYAGQRTSFYAFFEPEVIEERVLVLRFAGDLGSGEGVCGEDPVVSEVGQYTLADGKAFAFNEEITPTVGNERTLLQEFLGDIGKFSRPEL